MNPAYAQNPQAQMIVNKILLLTGKISPMEISMTPPAPAGNPVGGAPPSQSAGGKVAQPNVLSAVGNNQ